MSGQDRLATWREFRHSFPDDGNEMDVVNAFATTVVGRRYLDYYTPESWPNIFDIVRDGMLCQTGLTLVMASTLVHLGFMKAEQLQFDAISNHITGNDGIILVYQDACYNFLPDEIVDVKYATDNSTIFARHFIAVDKFPC